MVLIFRSPNSERRDSFEESAESEETINLNEKDENDDIDPPLLLATLDGKQEIVMRFTEMNQFGLPRAVDEIDIGLGQLKFHIYPHQVHILSEIAAAVTVPPKPVVKSSRQQRNMFGLEGMIQENLRMGGPMHHGQGLNLGWGERTMESSREFMPTVSRSQGFITDERRGQETEQDQSGSPPMPRIKVRVASSVGILHMRDPGIIKLGGEPTRLLAVMSMRLSAETFFTSVLSLPVWDSRKLNKWHTTLGASLETSHLQVLVSPVTIVYEEGNSVGTNLVSQYAAMTSVILGKVSLVECLFDNSVKSKPQLINILKFHHSEGGAAKKTPDMKLVYKDCFDPGETSPVSSLSLSFNSCCIDLDPGFIDRLLLL